MRSMKRRLASLLFPERGGARKGAGRKPKGGAAGVSHAKRGQFPARCPVHVSMKVVRGLPSLRSRRVFRVVRDAILMGAERFGMLICQFSVQSNHFHLLVEASGKESLSRGMQGLAIRMAKRIQRALGHQGSVFADRYFSRVLRTPLEVKRALAYVLENARKHGLRHLGIDPCSSGVWFDGWHHCVDDSAGIARRSPLPLARSWLLRLGWRRHGAVELGAVGGRS